MAVLANIVIVFDKIYIKANLNHAVHSVLKYFHFYQIFIFVIRTVHSVIFYLMFVFCMLHISKIGQVNMYWSKIWLTIWENIILDPKWQDWSLRLRTGMENRLLAHSRCSLWEMLSRQNIHFEKHDGHEIFPFDV